MFKNNKENKSASNQENIYATEYESKEAEKVESVIITDWKQMKQKNQETHIVPLAYPDGTSLGVEIYSLSKSTMNALSEKYDAMKKPKPPKVPIKDGKNVKWIDAPVDSSEYLKWEQDNKAIDNLKAAETIILALVVKPEGDTLEDQITFINDTFKSGHLDTLLIEIYKFSGYDLNAKIDQAKNS